MSDVLELPTLTARELRSIASGGPGRLSLARFDKRSVSALERRGLVEVDHYMGHVQITDKGLWLVRKLRHQTRSRNRTVSR